MYAWTRSLFLLAALTGTAAAQAPAGEPQPALLAGPSVAETNITTLNSSFVEPENQRQRLAGGVDARILRPFIAELRESNDPALRLTPEQQVEINMIVRDYQTRMTEFEQNAREWRRLRGQEAQPTRRDRPGQVAEPMRDERPMSPEPMMAPDSAARSAELEALRPDPAELQKQFRAVLNEPQRRVLDERIEAALKERSEQRQMEQIRKEVAAQMARQTPARVNLERLPPRIRERIERLPPEERAAALERLRAQSANRDALSRPDPAGEKPAPSMDDVDIPRPGGG